MGAFTPKSIVCWREGYSLGKLRHDLLAGVTVGIIALPLAMAFAIGAGVDPERGLYTAIVAGFLTSLLSGSRVQIGGPTGAFVVIIADIVARHGYNGLAVATIMAAIILVVLGLLKAGMLIRFIPFPVTVGFTSGIATVIFFAQGKDLFGLPIDNASPNFLTRLAQYAASFQDYNGYALVLGVGTLVFLFLMRRIAPRIPAAIFAIVIATLVSHAFNMPVATIVSTYGPIPSTLPEPSLPSISLEAIRTLFPDAITIALLAGIESLLCCVIADGMTGTRHKPNCELVAQGIANFGSILFGGIPATGAIARTTANIQFGATSPVSGIVHAITLLLLMALIAPIAGYIPLCSLAGLLCFIAWNMAEQERFVEICKGNWSDAAVLLATYLLTVLVDITVAVQAGIILAAILFLKHMSDSTLIKLYAASEEDLPDTHIDTPIPSGVQVFELDGPLFFGVADILNETLQRLPKQPHTFILRMRGVPLIDASGLQALYDFTKRCKRHNITFYIVEARPRVKAAIASSPCMHYATPPHLVTSLPEALQSL